MKPPKVFVSKADALAGGGMSPRALSPWPEKSPRRGERTSPLLPPINTSSMPSLVLNGGGDLPFIEEEEFRPRASTISVCYNKPQEVQSSATRDNHLDVTDADFRPRASSFHGRLDTVSENSADVAEQRLFPCSSVENIPGPNIHFPRNTKIGPEKANLKDAALKVIKDLRAKEADQKDLQEFPVLSRMYRKSVFGESSQKRSPVRVGSFASLVGIALFRKFYNAELDAHVKNKEVKASADNTPNYSSDEWDSESDDEDFSQLDHTHSLFQGLSDEAKVAYMKCYEDKLRNGLVGKYPKYKNRVLRRDSLSLGAVCSHQLGVSDSLLSDRGFPRLEDEFVRGTHLMDALKLERGEHVTSTRFVPSLERQWPDTARPTSKALVKRYNAWSQSWSKTS